jgi:non-lysosomal glucosylceramidase
MRYLFSIAAFCSLSLHAGAASPFTEAAARFDQAQKHGFSWSSAQRFTESYVGKGGATDEGPWGLPLLGGIGTGAFGRDLNGHFDRWQLQPGFPRKITIEAANPSLRWQQGEKVGAYRLGEAGWDRPLPAGTRSVAVMWPIVSERLSAPEWPVEMVIESWSPVIPHDEEAASMPVAFFDVYARNTSAEAVRLDLALFMPNFLGWRKGVGNVGTSEAEQKPKREPPARMGARHWPERCNSGNYAQSIAPKDALLGGVMLQRGGYTQPTQDMEGQILLGVSGDAAVKAQRLISALANGKRDHIPEGGAGYFLSEAEEAFFKTGLLPSSTKGWQATATEVLTSAVSGGLELAPGAEGHFTLVMVWDMPLVQFGSGRTWEKAYTSRFGADGRQAQRIAQVALSKRDAWRQQIQHWHEKTLGAGDEAQRKRHGAAMNDLYFVVSGGTAWVAKEHPRPGLKPPLLGSGEHFSILEGFDTGYYFTSTFDLWPHAQPALEANWPRLSGLLLDDFLKVAPMSVTEPRFIVNTGEVTVRKVPHKIPHDVGCPSGDPWHLINEYNTARDSNVWKDHNPEFILSLYLHRKHAMAPAPDEVTWKTLLAMTDFMIAQDKQKDGLPYHDVQGDNTWDALHFTGPSPYSGSLTIGAWAAMAEWAKQRGDAEAAKRFGTRLALAQASFEKHFWNGRYYRGASNGEQADWLLCDALLGILIADSAGLRDLLPAQHITAHLRRVAERNWQGLLAGQIGPALLAPDVGPIPPDQIQIGEVIVGSARSSIALMQRYGLTTEAAAMTDAINGTLYQVSGLQFRTPAAWSAQKTFRAPNNMRPLASWHSMWPAR